MPNDVPESWDGERFHPEAPTDDDGYPLHPDRGFHICGRKKSDRTTPNGKEHDAPYCTLGAGWGTDDPGTPGKACKHHGGKSGAPEGPRNGNWKNGLYSEHFTEEDAERADAWIELTDGDRLTIEDFARMGEKALLYEFTRIERAMTLAPDPDVSYKWACEFCGQGLTHNQIYVCPSCENTLDEDSIIPIGEWVDMHDRSISERAERWMEMLKRYKEIVDGSDVNVNLGVSFEDAIRRAQTLADEQADTEDKVEVLYGEPAPE